MTPTTNPLFENEGHCSICMSQTTFEARNEWLRDYYVCRGCGSIPRQRAIVEVLNFIRPMWRNLRIHESSPDYIRQFFVNQCPAYSYSYYFDGVPLGEEKEGTRCENLEQLTFPDSHFDLFITQDVMEHVLSPQNAFAEMMRVLKPGGAMLFTAPKHKNLVHSRQRAKSVNGEIEYLMEPDYHGNPIGDGRSLVTWDYGADFEDLIKEWTGYLTSTFVIRDQRRGIDGEFLEVFVTVKIPVNHVAA